MLNSTAGGHTVYCGQLARGTQCWTCIQVLSLVSLLHQLWPSG